VRAACCSHVEGMNEHFLPTEDEAAFEAYLDTLAAALHHRSRKQPLRDYCTGLLLPEGRKSMEPMAARLAPARTRTMHKTLLNFVSEGAWSDEAVLAAMRSQVLPAMQAHGPLRFWIVDESGMPKKGKHSVGVARQYCGEVGKVDNCQVLVSLSVANEAACLPLAARLYLPEAWAVDEERRSKVGVPLDVVFQSKPAIALEQIRAAHVAGVPPGVVLADEVYGSTASFRQGVSALGLDYAAAVRATTPVRPPLDKRRARLWRGQDAALSVRALAARVPRSAWRWVTWREGSGPELSGRFAAIRVRVGRDGAEGEQTLLLEWPVGATDPVGYWLVTLARQTPLHDVVATAKGRWWVEQNYRELKQEVGLGDFEGRGWRGFHHHLTLSFAAYGFLVMRRCQQPWPAGGRAGVLSFPVVADPTHPPIRPERHAPTSIPTMRRRLTVGLARRLPRCPCCQTPHSEQVLVIQPLLLSA
jgi:SRSO17 transposase